MADVAGFSKHWRNESARTIAVEVERVLKLHKVPIEPETLNISGKLAAYVVLALTSLSDERLGAISSAEKAWPEATLRLVMSLAEESANVDWEAKRPCNSRTDSEPAGGEKATADIKSRLQSIQRWAGKVVGQTFLEHHLGIPRSTLHLWKRRNQVVALRNGSRNHVFPLAQFIDSHPVAGIRDVLAEIPDPRSAWLWLSRPEESLGHRIPLDMLRDDCVAEVLSASRAYRKNREVSSG